MAEATAPPDAPYVLPPELLIDTGVARQIIGEFIRGHLDQTGFKRMVLALSGGLDSALVAYLLAESIGADNLLCVMLPYRTSSPESRSDAEAVIAAIGCESKLVDITPMVDGYFGTETAGWIHRQPPTRQLRRPHAHGRHLRQVRRMERPGVRNREQD